MILRNFQIFTLVRKKNSTIFVDSGLECPFIKFSFSFPGGVDVSDPWVSFVTTDEFSASVTKITARTGVSLTHSLAFCF